jgi:sugar phosphate isomerase/epimerase
MIKLAFSTNAFKRYSLEDSIREIARLGYEGVEILCDIPHAYPPVFKDEQIQSLRKILVSLNIQVSNLNAFTLYALGDVYHPSWIEDGREMRIKHTIDCIKIANKIGIKHLSTEPGGPVLPECTDVDPLENLFLEGLAKVSKIAEEENVKVLVEPEPGLLIENSRQFKKLITRVADPNQIRLNFDIGHFYCVNEDPATLVYELSEYIEHFHLADIASTRVHNHLIPGKGAIDFRRVFDAMDDIGYSGYVTIELYPYQDNPIRAAEEAHGYLCNIL